MKPPFENVNVLGMPLDRWTVRSCTADIATGAKWATVYYIESKEEGKGDATKLLEVTKKYYEEEGLQFGCTTALHPAIDHICKKLNIPVYN